MARQPGCCTGSSERAFSKQCCMCPVKPSHRLPKKKALDKGFEERQSLPPAAVFQTPSAFAPH